MIKVVVIDDHELVLHGLNERLKQENGFEVVGAFTNYQDLLLCLSISLLI